MKSKVLFMDMKNPENHLQTLSEIRSLMERSSRFISLSGLSGVFAGVFALIGASAAYFYLGIGLFSEEPYYVGALERDGSLNWYFIRFFLIDAVSVLVLSLFFGIYFTTRKAKKQGLKIWDSTSIRLTYNLFIPLATGGIFCLMLLYHGHFEMVAPTTLIFYGLALLNASKYTLNDIRYLGISEILLGLIASFWVSYALLFWSIGFGVLHIFYGMIMYFKYER